jgi:hypothetical protein
LVRPTKEAVVIYKFADDSGDGFGSSLSFNNDFHYKSEQWNEQHCMESSNHRELSNLAYSIEDAHQKGLLQNTELYMCFQTTALPKQLSSKAPVIKETV